MYQLIPDHTIRSNIRCLKHRIEIILGFWKYINSNNTIIIYRKKLLQQVLTIVLTD